MIALPSILLLLVAVLHMVWLHPVRGMSKWKGGGLGVYCAPYERRVATWVDFGDGFRLAQTTPYANARLFEGWFPYVPFAGEHWMEQHGRKIARQHFQAASPLKAQARARPSAAPSANELGLPVAIVVQEWNYEYRSTTRAQWRLVRIWKQGTHD